MKHILAAIFIVLFLIQPVSALEFMAPEVPEAGSELMPETNSFHSGLGELLKKVIPQLRPDLAEAARVSFSVVAVALMMAILQTFSGSPRIASDFAGAVVVAMILLWNTNSLIPLGTQTVTEISEYGKLLLPVMTAAMAAEGGIGASAALYTGTALFNSILTTLISRLLIPMIYLFLALSAANCAVGEDLLKRMRDMIKGWISWTLKTLLTVFTTYMSITGVVSGTTDAAALKATKATISSVVPVVGGILSDASEAILVSAGLAKNAAGIYGIFAVLAVFLGPFLRIGIHYLILKTTAALCSIFATKRMTDLVADFSTAMGLLLAMTGSACLLQLISTVCFLKGVG